jgi:hypothetical protein
MPDDEENRLMQLSTIGQGAASAGVSGANAAAGISRYRCRAGRRRLLGAARLLPCRGNRLGA